MTFYDAGDVWTGDTTSWEDRDDRTADEDRNMDPRDVAGAYDELGAPDAPCPTCGGLGQILVDDPTVIDPFCSDCTDGRVKDGG